MEANLPDGMGMDAWAFSTHLPIKNPDFSWVQYQYNRDFNFSHTQEVVKELGGGHHPSEASMMSMIEMRNAGYFADEIRNLPGFPWRR